MGGVKKYRARKVYADKLNVEGLESEDKLMAGNTAGKGEAGQGVDKSNKGKFRTKKIRMSMTKAEEKKLDKALEMENQVSAVFIAIVLVLSFVVGITLGYILYKIALTGSI